MFAWLILFSMSGFKIARRSLGVLEEVGDSAVGGLSCGAGNAYQPRWEVVAKLRERV